MIFPFSNSKPFGGELVLELVKALPIDVHRFEVKVKVGGSQGKDQEQRRESGGKELCIGLE